MPPKAIKIPTSFEEFAKLRAKMPANYTFNDDGNAVVMKDGDELHTIELPTYRKTTLAELLDMEEKRKEAISQLEDQYEAAMDKLRERIRAYRDGKRSANGAVRANIAVEELDIALQTVKYPVELLNIIEHVDKNRVLYEQKYDMRKLEHPLVCHVGYPYEFQAYYVRESDEIVEESIPTELSSEEIYFDDPDGEHGYLSPYWPIEFVVGETRYFTAGQAVAAEAAKLYGDDIVRKELLNTRSPKTIRKLRRDLLKAHGPVEPAKLKEIQYAVQKAKFTQSRELLDLLLGTGDAPLMYANSSVSEGLGKTEDELRAGSKPTGTNLVGQVLQELRSELRMVEDADGFVKGSAAEATKNQKEATVSADTIAQRRLFFIRNSKK